jgi:hypothetical protein
MALSPIAAAAAAILLGSDSVDALRDRHIYLDLPERSLEQRFTGIAVLYLIVIVIVAVALGTGHCRAQRRE